MMNSHQKISPFLMFYGDAEEAMNFYTSIFDESNIESVVHQENGDVMHAKFTLNGQNFMAIDSTGEDIPFTAAMSLFVTCETEEEIDRVFESLIRDGKILMDLAVTPFSLKFGWVEDKYGVSWQLSLESSVD